MLMESTLRQLLMQMKQLDGGKAGSMLLKSLWLQRLPEGTQAILACGDGGSLEMLAATADKIHEVHAPRGCKGVACDPRRGKIEEAVSREFIN